MGSDCSKLFPYDALLEQFRKFGVYSAYVGALLIPMICADVDTMPDMNDADTNTSIDDLLDENVMRIPDGSKQAYNKHITDMFDDLVRLGYL